jgi:plasmid maintenance system antidote protein VapI
MRKTFSEALVDHLTKHGTRVTDIARATGVSKEALYSLKYGKTQNMTVDDAVKVAAFFDETVEEFMGLSSAQVRDSFYQRLSQLSDRERAILEAAITAFLGEQDPQPEAPEPDKGPA